MRVGRGVSSRVFGSVKIIAILTLPVVTSGSGFELRESVVVEIDIGSVVVGEVGKDLIQLSPRIPSETVFETGEFGIEGGIGEVNGEGHVLGDKLAGGVFKTKSGILACIIRRGIIFKRVDDGGTIVVDEGGTEGVQGGLEEGAKFVFDEVVNGDVVGNGIVLRKEGEESANDTVHG